MVAEGSLGLKTYLKSPEGKYKLHSEYTPPKGLPHPHYAHAKTTAVTQVTIAHLKDKPVQAPSQSSPPGSGVGIGVRSAAAARFLGSKALSLVGINGGIKSVNVTTDKLGSDNVVSNSNFDGEGTYLVFNIVEAIFVSDLNSLDKDPIKSIEFSNLNIVCHAFDNDAMDEHDLVIGFSSGEVFSVSLRQQLQNVGMKLVGAQHYNKDGSVNNSRCTCIAWIPNGAGSFIVAHADGNMYVYEKNKDASGDCSFPMIKDQNQFSVSHARHSKNPVARWHICQGSINGMAFSTDGTYIATVGRDGYLRVFDYKSEELIFGGKSYYGALLCCAWSLDGKYILAGGEDDLIQVWSVEEKRIVAWGEGHSSWVSAVAFDSHWSAPNSDGTSEHIVYRFGSVGQDTQLLLWDLEMDELLVPVRRAPGGSPTLSSGGHSHWDSACHAGTLHPSLSIERVPKLRPLVAHRVDTVPLSGLIFRQDSVYTVCRTGHIKVWMRPGFAENRSTNNSDSFASYEESLVSDSSIQKQ